MKAKGIQFKIVFLSLCLGLSACDSDSKSSTSNYQPHETGTPYHQTTPEGGSVPVTESQPSPTPATVPKAAASPDSEEEKAAKESFSKAFANSKKQWTLRNVTVNFSKGDVQTKQTENWTADCAAEGPLSIDGTYPDVLLDLGGFNCGEHQSDELADLATITENLQYRVRSDVALGFQTQNQMVLTLGSSYPKFFNWKSARSLNSGMRTNESYFDFQGEEKGFSPWSNVIMHVVGISIHQEKDGSEKLEVTYHKMMGVEQLQVKIKADLIRN